MCRQKIVEGSQMVIYDASVPEKSFNQFSHSYHLQKLIFPLPLFGNDESIIFRPTGGQTGSNDLYYVSLFPTNDLDCGIGDQNFRKAFSLDRETFQNTFNLILFKYGMLRNEHMFEYVDLYHDITSTKNYSNSTSVISGKSALSRKAFPYVREKNPVWHPIPAHVPVDGDDNSSLYCIPF